MSKDDVEMLQDLIVAAVNDAHRKVDEELKSKVGGLMGGLGLPGTRDADGASRVPAESRSTNSSGCPASAPRARSGWRFTC